MAATLAAEWRKCAILIVLFAVVVHIPTIQGNVSIHSGESKSTQPRVAGAVGTTPLDTSRQLHGS